MNYADLSPNERIAKASEYATILIGEGKLESDIINELMSSFKLTEDEAKLAIVKMRTDFSDSYKQSINFNIWKGIFAFIIFAVSALFFYGAASEVGPGVYYPIAFFLVIVSFGALFYSLRLIFQKYQLEESKKNRKEQPFILSLLIFSITVFLLFLFNYKTDAGIIDEQKTEVVSGLKISENVSINNTGGKSKKYYYSFRFQKVPHEFRFFDDYYRYSNPRIGLIDFKVGDTLSAQLLKKEFEEFNQTENNEKIDIVNITIAGQFVVDHKIRNKKIRAENKRLFELSLTALVMLVLAIVFWIIYKRVLMS